MVRTHRNRKQVLVFFSSLLALVTPTTAWSLTPAATASIQPAAKPLAPGITPPRLVVPKATASVLPIAPKPKRVTMDLVGADVRTVLRYLTRGAGLSLVLDDSATGNVSLDLRDMSYEDALAVVLKAKDLASKQIGNALLVATTAVLESRHLDDSTATIRLDNAVAADVARNITPMLPKSVILFPDPRSNSIALKGPDDIITAVRKLIQSLDHPVGQVLIEVKMVEMSQTDGDALRIAYGNSSNTGSGGAPLPVYVGGSTVNGSFTPEGAGTTVNINPLQPFQLQTFNAQLTWLVTKGKATILANPKVLAQDSAQATINLVNQVPYVTYQVSSTGQQLPQVSFVNIGQSLNITPHIDSSGYITMTMAPEITTTGGTPVTIGGSPIPVVNRRSVSTTLRVKDGESIVIGGLLREDKSNNISQIPLLGDLPLIGAMFRQNNSNSTKNEIIVLVTPHIVKTGEAPAKGS